MSEETTYSRITLNCETPYARKNGGLQKWTMKFALSGTAQTDQTEIEQAALDLWEVPRLLTNPATSLTGWLYYPPGSAVNSHLAVYGSGEKPGSGDGYQGGSVETQLEVCILAQAYCGLSAKGRPVYLRKHIHDCKQGQPGVVASFNSSVAPALLKWSTGVGPNSLVTVSPKTGLASQPWVIKQPLYTRQLRRGESAKA